MDFSLGKDIIIADYTKAVLAWCNKHLVFANPDYLKKEAMGKWTGNTQRNIVLFELVGNKLIVPFGVYEDLYKTFRAEWNTVQSRIKPVGRRRYASNINLYDYQQNAVEAVLRAKNGILVAPCGSGKTQMGLEIVARLGVRTLWLTHTQDLLNQSMSRAKECFGIDKSEYGTITEGKVNIGNTITFATVQTMCRIDLPKYRDCWDCVIVDECHKCVGSPTNVMMFYKVLSNLSARYKIGLTATPYRADGLERTMFTLLGNVICTVPKEAVEDKTCPVKVSMISTGFTPDVDKVTGGDGVLNYSKLIDEVITDGNRNKLVANTIYEAAWNGAVLVLSDRLQHLDVLENLVKSKIPSVARLGVAATKAAKERRKRLLNALNDGELNVVFATFKLAKEGLDVPNLRTIVFATPQKDKATVIQSAGRVARKADGKKFGRVIDFIDDFGIFYGYASKRKKYYKSLNYEVEL